MSKQRKDAASRFLDHVLSTEAGRNEAQRVALSVEVALAILEMRQQADMSREVVAERVGTSLTVEDLERIETGNMNRIINVDRIIDDPILESISNACGYERPEFRETGTLQWTYSLRPLSHHFNGER